MRRVEGRDTMELRQEGSCQGGCSNATKRSHGVGGDAGWLMSKGSWWEVVKYIGESWWKGTIILGSHNHNSIALLDLGIGCHQPFRNIIALLYEVQRLL